MRKEKEKEKKVDFRWFSFRHEIPMFSAHRSSEKWIMRYYFIHSWIHRKHHRSESTKTNAYLFVFVCFLFSFFFVFSKISWISKSIIKYFEFYLLWKIMKICLFLATRHKRSWLDMFSSLSRSKSHRYSDFEGSTPDDPSSYIGKERKSRSSRETNIK